MTRGDARTDGPDESAGLDDALHQLTELRAQFDDVRERLVRARYEGRSDDDRITALVDSTGHLVGLTIDPRVFRAPDSDGLAEAILTAVRNAAAAATEGSNEIVREVLGANLDFDALVGSRSAEGTARPERDHLQLLNGGGQPFGSGPDFGGWAA